ncbi:MAG: c-type cytochrome [Helicobacteraceae bacterium]|jgi:cytochrome c553|nr:c-type cytochrome [Helicobacteraceae bacterium]
MKLLSKASLATLLCVAAYATDPAVMEQFREGETLFKHCIPCHGKYASERPMGKDANLSRLSEKTIADKLAEYRKEGNPGAMEAQAALLDDRKRAALAKYIANMYRENGKEIFQLRCSGCHGKDASKSAFGRSGKVARFSESEAVVILRNYQNGAYAGGSTANTMKSRAVNLSDQEVLELGRYIGSLAK